MSCLCSPQRPLRTAVSPRSAGLDAAAACGLSSVRSAACAGAGSRGAGSRGAALCRRQLSTPKGSPETSWVPGLFLVSAFVLVSVCF